MNKRKTSVQVQKLSSLSVFLPCYNEEANIEKQVREVLAVVPHVAKKYEVIIINDGSKDKTREIGQRLGKKYASVRLVSQRNKGYGGAVKRGFAESRYDWVFFTDADLQFDVCELVTLVGKAGEMDMVLGYRVSRADGRKRQILAKGLKLWNRVWLGFPRNIRDIDCAFKLIRQEVIVAVQPLVSDGAMVSTEFLLKAHHKGFAYDQVGVSHYNRLAGKSTGSNAGVIWRAIMDTFVLRKVLFKQTSIGKRLVWGKRMVEYSLVGAFLLWMGVKR